MNEDEIRLKEEELRETREFRNEDLKERKRARVFTAIGTVVAIATVMVSVCAVNSTITASNRQTALNGAQFKQNFRNTTYNDIVAGLGSTSAAVQVNSMRLLRQYVTNPSNYDNPARAQEGIDTAVKTLAAFIEDKSVATSIGLPDYESPQPIVLSRAMQHLASLVSKAELGSHNVDISRANLHGLNLPNLVPRGSFVAVATDFRRATLANLSLKETTAPPDMRRAFFTCATLRNAKFGQANVDKADFSGANLSGADLSEVKNLTSEQLHGARVAKARLPAGVQAPAIPWGGQKCADILDMMTGMLQGQGYDPAIPCPTKVGPWGDSLSRRRFKGNVNDLVEVCKARIN